MKQPLAIILVGLAAAALFGGLVHAVLVAALLVPLVARIRKVAARALRRRVRCLL
jgi:hypothetical protein